MSDSKSTHHSVSPRQEAECREEQAKYRAIADAARSYARRTARGGTLEFIHTFLTALRVGIASMPKKLMEDDFASEILKGDIPAMPEQLSSNPIYLKNVMNWINAKEFVVGGSRTVDFPDCVGIGDIPAVCSGTLIAPQVVLTAGHCVGFPPFIYVGENMNGNPVVTGFTPVQHPAFDPDTKENDLALLFLDDPVEDVKPCVLAESRMIDLASEICVVGFGYDDPMGRSGLGVKRTAKVPIISKSCPEPDALRYSCNEDLELVAIAPNCNSDTCDGDSGGPAYVQADAGSEWFLAAVTSRGFDHRRNPCGDGGIYVRVDKYKDWIDECMHKGP